MPQQKIEPRRTIDFGAHTQHLLASPARVLSKDLRRGVGQENKRSAIKVMNADANAPNLLRQQFWSWASRDVPPQQYSCPKQQRDFAPPCPLELCQPFPASNRRVWRVLVG